MVERYTREQIIEIYTSAEDKIIPSHYRECVESVENYIFDEYNKIVRMIGGFVSLCGNHELCDEDLCKIRKYISVKTFGASAELNKENDKKYQFGNPVYSFYNKTVDCISLSDIDSNNVHLPLWWFDTDYYSILKTYARDILYMFMSEANNEIAKIKSEISMLELKCEKIEKMNENLKNANVDNLILDISHLYSVDRQ